MRAPEQGRSRHALFDARVCQREGALSLAPHVHSPQTLRAPPRSPPRTTLRVAEAPAEPVALSVLFVLSALSGLR